ncbi:Cation/calcium exchanger 5 [Bienertia sinuspersici]
MMMLVIDIKVMGSSSLSAPEVNDSPDFTITVEPEPPKTDQLHVVLVAFVMSVFWISNVAGELLNCLAALGKILNLPPTILGLTVLAWGNSVGDLVADVAVAKAGQPALAMAGCFAGPMFNMLIG